jgi:adenylate cyclase
MSPENLVGLLNSIFTAFDDVAAKWGVEKIKTIGDAYMAAAGLPVASQDHAVQIAEVALDMLQVMTRFSRPDGAPLDLRIGIGSGPVVAGVIGQRKFIYDLWGDTVNVASRMESHGVPGRIQVTEQTRDLLRTRYSFERRGTVEIKGRGEMVTHFLLGRLEA